MRKLVLQVFVCAALASAATAGSSTWFDLVSPVMTTSEKKLYLSLSTEARTKFEQDFWSGKAVTAEEYFKRIQYVDSTFGSSKPASGANTDPGRVYLALGPPNKVTRIPSSRIFVPLEIWYYDAVPGILNTELRLIFYQKSSLGLPRLYSPTADTIRALLVPQASTRSMFGPNAQLSESDIRNTLKVPTVEDEVVSASVNVATGIKYTGNDEILGQITSPETILRKPLQTKVSSRLITARPKLDLLLTPSDFGGLQVDFRLVTHAQRQVDIEVLQDAVTVYQNHLQLKFSKAESIEYTHRLDLLPGTYQVMFTVDGKTYPYPLQVREKVGMSAIFRTDPPIPVDRRKTPFEFEGQQVRLNPVGKMAAVALAHPDKVTWMLRRGAEVFWKASSLAQAFSSIELPTTGIPPGTYQLEVITGQDSRTAEVLIAKENRDDDAAVISYNANLAPGLRFAFVGHQWLLRGNLAEARKSLDASLAQGATHESQLELARVDVLEGRLDEGRERVRRVLEQQPDDFQALSILAFIETRLQDYSVAAELYRHALAVQDSPALRVALAQLPKQ